MNVSNDSNKYVIDGNTRSASMKVPPLEGLSDSYYPSEQHFTENYPKNVQNNNQYYNNQQYIQVASLKISFFYLLTCNDVYFSLKLRLFTRHKMIIIYRNKIITAHES